MKSRFILACMALGLFAGTAHAGAVGGPKNGRDVVLAHSTDVFVVVFEKGKFAEANVNGDGSTDLDCTVTDSNGKLVASDFNPTDYCSLIWIPSWTGKFFIRIRNRGGEPNEYTVTTN